MCNPTRFSYRSTYMCNNLHGLTVDENNVQTASQGPATIASWTPCNTSFKCILTFIHTYYYSCACLCHSSTRLLLHTLRWSSCMLHVLHWLPSSNESYSGSLPWSGGVCSALLQPICKIFDLTLGAKGRSSSAL